MLLRSSLFAGLLLLSGCAYSDDYYGGNTVGYDSATTYYGGQGYYGSPYQSGPVYGSPYVSGPLFYYYDDDYGRRRRHNGGWDNDDWHHDNHGNGNQGGWQHHGGNGNQSGWCKPGQRDCQWNNSGQWPHNPDRPNRQWQNQGQNQNQNQNQNQGGWGGKHQGNNPDWQARTDRNPANHNQKNGTGAVVPPTGCGAYGQAPC
jgi:hypothetical protein